MNHTGARQRNAGSFQQSTLNENVNLMSPKDRPTMRTTNMSCAGIRQESNLKVVKIYSKCPALEFVMIGQSSISTKVIAQAA